MHAIVPWKDPQGVGATSGGSETDGATHASVDPWQGGADPWTAPGRPASAAGGLTRGRPPRAVSGPGEAGHWDGAAPRHTCELSTRANRRTAGV